TNVPEQYLATGQSALPPHRHARPPRSPIWSLQGPEIIVLRHQLTVLRRELLDRTIIWNQRQLDRLVINYIEHFNTHRPHRTLNQQPPLASSRSGPPAPRHLQVVKSTRCGGLIHEYRNAA
ncbi:MAG: transposase, partial [bacterium]|nr:transposase [bacterium]